MQAPTVVKPQHLFSEKDYAILVLNRDIQLGGEFFMKIWNNASIRHVVDGGANRFFNFVDKLPSNFKEGLKLPELASGDFDSISDESMERLRKDGSCKIVLTEDQDHTDFTKALAILREHLKVTGTKLSKVIVICESNGRLDQIVSNLNTLHQNVFLEDPILSETVGVYLIGAENLTWLIPADKKMSIAFQDEVPNLTCGIVPFMGPTKLTSQGLKWDLTPEMVCNFGGILSTCNVVTGKTVEITSIDNHSIFTVQIFEDKYILHE